MPNNRYASWVPAVIVSLLLVTLVMVWAVPLLRSPNNPDALETNPTAGADTYKARVIEIIETGEIELGEGLTQPYQIAAIRLMEGPFADVRFEIDYGRRQIRPAGTGLRTGEQILVTIAQAPDQLPEAFFVDWVRTPPLLWLLAAFIAVSLLVSGWKGLRSLVAMALSLLIIVMFILPRILAGGDPVTVSIMGAFAILACTLYLVYGWTLKTHAAVLGTFTALIITGLLAGYYVSLTRLTGFGSEEAMFLSQEATINLRGLVLGGILIGALGVLDDLVITQASVIFELHAANPALDLRALYRRGMRIGQDHVAATVNTLVLAYAGAALPLLLLVTQAGENWVNFVNREFVTEEIVRTLVGSLGLMSAVPLTTGLACLVALYHGRLGQLGQYLGPATLADGHDHHHH
jgi:uncharacterized membrane protein